MAELLIDITRLLGRKLAQKFPTGVDRVDIAYVKHFQTRARALVRYGRRWMVLNDRDSHRMFDVLLKADAYAQSKIRWCVARNYLFNWRSYAASAILLNISHNGLHQSDYRAKLLRRRWHAFFFLHDLIPITHPEYSRPGEADRHHKRLATMLAAGQGIIVNSRATEEMLRQYVQNHNMPMPPCVVAPLAPADFPPSSSDIRPLDKPYFVILGTIEGRKNHLVLLQIWRQLIEELGEQAPRLVIIGQRGWECEQVIDLLDHCEALCGFVIEKPSCNDAEIANWLTHAHALLFPSFTEGFGIPLVEALTLNLPVIASDLPVFHEIAGEIPTYLSPRDVQGWKRTILEYMSEDSPYRQEQLGRMKGYSAPTWEKHFAIVEAFIKARSGETV